MAFNYLEHQLALGRVIKFIASRGYSVSFSSNTYYVVKAEQTVYAPKRYKNSCTCICALLHEAGHIVLNSSILLQARYSNKRNKAVIIEQEYLAWSEGLNIAKHLYIATPAFTQFYIKEWISNWSSYIEIHKPATLDSLIAAYQEDI